MKKEDRYYGWNENKNVLFPTFTTKGTWRIIYYEKNSTGRLSLGFNRGQAMDDRVRNRLKVKANNRNQRNQNQQNSNKKEKRVTPEVFQNSRTQIDNTLNIDWTSANKKINSNFIGIKVLVTSVSNWMQVTSQNSTIMHKITYFSPSLTRYIYKVLNINDDAAYIKYLSDTFFASIWRRCELLNLKRNTYQRLLWSIQRYNLFYYLINFYYLASSQTTYDNFVGFSGIKMVRAPWLFRDIISHFKSTRVIHNSSLEGNQIRHIFDNSDIRNIIFEIKRIISYPQIDDITDDFLEAYTDFIALLEILCVEFTEINTSISVNRYLHTGLYSHLSFIGCDYFVNLDEFMFNVFFLKTVEVYNAEDSYIYQPEITTLNKEDSEHHINNSSFNVRMENFFNDQLGLLPNLWLEEFPGGSDYDPIYEIESSQSIQRKLTGDSLPPDDAKQNNININIDWKDVEET